jgi:hypothetical protein
MPRRGRHPFKQQPRDTRSHKYLEALLDQGALDSGEDNFVRELDNHNLANETRLTIRRGARHFGISAAVRVLRSDGTQCTYDCPDPDSPHDVALQLFSKEVAWRYLYQQTGGDASKLKYNPYKRRT